MARLFGTDGVRGIANTELSPTLALKLGAASAYVLRGRHSEAKILMGRDPRISGDILESAMASGICSIGVDVYLTGVAPTPAVAFMTQLMQADAGVVISASHNPMRDNGIKFFGADGYKLPDEIEDEIEARMKNFKNLARAEGAGVGRMFRVHDMIDGYVSHLISSFPHKLGGIKLVLDCANGAVCEAGPKIFSALGADVEVIHNKPDGININDNCGSQHLDDLRRAVLSAGAQAGMAFDGDGDRAILVDEKGRAVDGDRVMAICAIHLAREGRLPHSAVVATVMSNMGLEVALRREGISLVRTRVGDRYVSDEMRRTGIIVGGEKSGHLIFSRHSTTGDGLVTALQVLNVMLLTGKPLSELGAMVEEFPQTLVNVPVKDKNGWENVPEVGNVIKESEQRLAGRGRVLVRASGTENLIRVMTEGPDLAELQEITGAICDVVKSKLG
jgi:phosphoglucosamine mutase